MIIDLPDDFMGFEEGLLFDILEAQRFRLPDTDTLAGIYSVTCGRCGAERRIYVGRPAGMEDLAGALAGAGYADHYHGALLCDDCQAQIRAVAQGLVVPLFTLDGAA